MLDHCCYDRSDFLNLYLQGRWQVFLDSSVVFDAGQLDLEIFYRSLRDLTPYRVQGQVLDSVLRDCLSPVKFLKLHSCRSSLTDVLIALSKHQPNNLMQVKLSSFSEYLCDVLIQDSTDCRSWVEHLIVAHQPDFLNSLRSYRCAHSYVLAGALPPKLTIVLGMHRSGTSALTGMLHASGLGAPNDALGATQSNPFGYWESSCLVELSNRLLHDLGSHWSRVFDLPPRWSTSPLVAQWISDYLQAFSLVFNENKHLVVKDPRLCILLEPLLPCLQPGLMEVDYLLILRSPVEVIASLNKSEGIGFNECLKLWIESVLSSERLTRHCCRNIVTFSDLLENPAGILRSCYAAWGIANVHNSHLQNAIGFVDVGLRRQINENIRNDLLVAYPHLSGLLNFAERLFIAVSTPEHSHQNMKLDQLRREWHQRREILESVGENADEARR